MILIDIREATGTSGGKSTYTFNLVLHLLKDPNFKCALISDRALPEDFASFSSQFEFILIPTQGSLWHYRVYQHVKSNLSKYTAYLSITSYITPFLLRHLDLSLYIVVHDLICFKHPENHHFKTVLLEKFFLPKIINYLTKIFVVSKHTGQDLQTVFPNLSQDKIIVAPCGFTPTLTPTSTNLHKSNLKLPESFILSVATIIPRKNFQVLIQAFSQIQTEHKLVLVGKIADSTYHKQLIKLIKKLNLQNKVIFYSYLNNDDLHTVYSKASLFLYPSLYEGFGIPILEAYSYNLPVIVANTSSLPEVAGQGALYFDPNSPAELAQQMQNLLAETTSSQSLKEALKEAQKQQLQKYTWSQTANEVSVAVS